MPAARPGLQEGEQRLADLVAEGKATRPRRSSVRLLPEKTQPPKALQKAIDAKAPAPEMKAALTKYLEYRKAKQADLDKARDALRAVLTSRQEAIATLSGLL